MPYDHCVTGKIVRRLRTRKHISQEVLSGLADISRSHLTMIENGQINPTVDTLWKISDALNIRFSYMMQLVEKELSNA